MAVTRSPRYMVKFHVVYDDGESFNSGPVVDLSESGLFIETVMPLKPGTRVRITPLLPEHAGLFEVEGEVVRADDYDVDNHFDRTPGMGVRLLGASSEVLAELKRLFLPSQAPPKAGPGTG